MVNSIDIYKSLNINIGTVMKNIEILKFVPDHLKTKKNMYAYSYNWFLNAIKLRKCVIKQLIDVFCI